MSSMRAAAVIWVTGLPSSGKSTLARRLQMRLLEAHLPCVLLDSDELRGALVPTPGYHPAERDAFYATLGRLAAMLARQGVVVIVAATANRRAHRDQARAAAPRFVEVFVDVPLAACEARDAKGLYRAARAGLLDGALPGVTAPYEPPRSPEVRAAGGRDDDAVRALLELLGVR